MRVVPRFVALPLLAWLALSFLVVSCREEERRPRVVVLGFDGANWETIDPLIEAGKLPYLKRLKEEAAWAPLETFKPTKSPVIWTSVATGKSMFEHGILDFVFLEENDLPVPYSNSEKREPSIWQILDHFGRRSVVVNWFVTYPPDRLNGVMVSNRFRKTMLLRENRAERMRDSVFPPSYFDELAGLIDLRYEDLLKEKGLPDLAEVHRGLHPEKRPEDIAVLKDFWIYVLQEALNENVARHLFEREEFDFFAAYFRLPDIVQHFLMEVMDPKVVSTSLSRLKDGSLSEADMARFRREAASVLEPVYGYMEHIVESFMTAEGHEDTYFVVLSDHGFSLHPAGYDHYQLPKSYPPPSGIFLMKGPGTKPGRLSTVNVYDVAPTILHVMGLPVGENMDGDPLTEMLAFDREVRRRRFGPELMKTEEGRRDEELDEQTLKELRSLGYIQ